MKVRVAAIQCALSDDSSQNIDKIAGYVKEAASKGAKIILPSELFEGHYFCKEEREENFLRATALETNPAVEHFRKLSSELDVVIPVSFFEKKGPAYFNTVAMVECGALLGVYRKSHIPDGPGYEEKFYFRGGDTGFKTWPTKYGNVGVGICWDQWFPECARAMALQGADVLLYPTAIGSEPANPALDTKDRWQRAMLGHSVCNVMPVVAANRVGQEGTQFFYGHSFISDIAGEKLCELGREEEGVLVAEFDWMANLTARAAWGFFRDRRPDLYSGLLTVGEEAIRK